MTTNDDNLAIEIDLVKYVSCRQNEINLLKSESFLAKENQTKSLFQLLPRHMRRRTMGYLRKRLPRRIRQQSTIKPPSKLSKRPSRKYRRKRSNLLKDYERRKRGAKMWLETHIWHAKRFKMSDSLYGYKLPLKFHCKCKRAVFKCLKEYSCIHDESYYVCHQLDGMQADILSGLSQLCSQDIGLTFGAIIYLEGRLEGRLTLYETGQFPYGCIGPVRFLWKPRDTSNENEIRSLWIWSHPAINQKVEEQIVKVFKMKNHVVSVDETTNEDKKSSPIAKKMKMTEEEDRSEKMELETYSLDSFRSDKVTLKSLKDQLVRFKLVGPMSTTVLASVLQAVKGTSGLNEEYEIQASIWDKIKSCVSSPNEVTQSSVISMLVKDPRLLLPKKKAFNKNEATKNQINCFSSIKKNLESDLELKRFMSTKVLSKSDIWNRNIINDLNKLKMSTHEINKLRSKHLIPGSDLSISEYSRIPILLVQSTLNNNMFSVRNGSFFSGWDVIVPNTWGMAFWLPLIHMGARAIGQDELNYLMFESGNLQFPDEYSDTPAGRINNEETKQALFKKFLAKPPSKRINFLKSGFLSPFSCPWNSVIKLNNLNSSSDSFFILRNRRLLAKIESLFFQKNMQIKLEETFTEVELNLINNSYVGVRLVSVDKGTLEKFSLVYTRNLNRSIDNEECLKLNKEFVNISIKKLVDESKKAHAGEVEAKNSSVSRPTLNKLIRAGFNRSNLLVDERVFLEHEINILGSEGHRTPVGFVQNNGFTLVSGKCNANAFVLTSAVVDLLRLKNNLWKESKRYFDPTIVEYRTPSCGLMTKKARIKHFFQS